LQSFFNPEGVGKFYLGKETERGKEGGEKGGDPRPKEEGDLWVDQKKKPEREERL